MLFLFILQMGNWDRLWLSGFLKVTPLESASGLATPWQVALGGSPSSDLKGRDPAFLCHSDQVWVWTPPWSGAEQIVRMTKGHVAQRMIQGNYSQCLTWGPLLCILSACPQGYRAVTRNSFPHTRGAPGNSITQRLGQVWTRPGAKKISFLPLPHILLPQHHFSRQLISWQAVTSFRGQTPSLPWHQQDMFIIFGDIFPKSMLFTRYYSWIFNWDVVDI